VVGHVNVLKSAIQLAFKFSYGGEIGRLAAKGANQFLRCAELAEGVEGEDFNVFDVGNAGVGVFFKQNSQDALGLFAVFGEDVTLLDLIGALAAG
jgi:hypothetical protein